MFYLASIFVSLLVTLSSFHVNAASWNEGNVPQLKGAKWFSFEDVQQCTRFFSHESQIGVGGYGKVSAVILYHFHFWMPCDIQASIMSKNLPYMVLGSSYLHLLLFNIQYQN